MLIAFDTPTWPKWLQRYRAGVRTLIDWDALVKRPPRVHTELVDCRFETPDIFHCWFSGGKGAQQWRDGSPQRHKRARTVPALLRLPAVEWRDGSFMILDGNHRLHAIGPRWLVLDALDLRRRGDLVKYFSDLAQWLGDLTC